MKDSEITDNEEVIINQIMRELGRAEIKFPQWPEDIIHADAIINEEKGELTRAVIQYSYEIGDLEEIRKEAIQTAAMCIRFLKRIDTYKAIKTWK